MTSEIPRNLDCIAFRVVKNKLIWIGQLDLCQVRTTLNLGYVRKWDQASASIREDEFNSLLERVCRGHHAICILDQNRAHACHLYALLSSVDLVPGLPYCLSMLAVGFKDVPAIARRWIVHKHLSVEIDPAHVLVTNPYVNMGRLEVVLPRVHNEAELSLSGDRRHPLLLSTSPPLIRRTYSLMYHKRYICQGDGPAQR